MLAQRNKPARQKQRQQQQQQPLFRRVSSSTSSYTSSSSSSSSSSEEELLSLDEDDEEDELSDISSALNSASISRPPSSPRPPLPPTSHTQFPRRSGGGGGVYREEFESPSSTKEDQSNASETDLTDLETIGGLSRKWVRVYVSILQTRRALDDSRWEVLGNAIGNLESALKGVGLAFGTAKVGWTSEGDGGSAVHWPILARLRNSLINTLSSPDLAEKSYKHSLTGTDAKALVALRKRWSRIASQVDDDGPSSEAWKAVGEYEKKHPLPGYLISPSSSTDSEPSSPSSAGPKALSRFLAQLEATLLIQTSRRISLSHLSLENNQMPEALENILEVLAWYTGGEIGSSESKNGEKEVSSDGLVESPFYQALRSIRILDLNHNRLRFLPSTILRNLPCLTTLSLGNNALEYLPPSIVLLSNLKKLNLRRNRLRRPNAAVLRKEIERRFSRGMFVEAAKERAAEDVIECGDGSSSVERLSMSCIRVIQENLAKHRVRSVVRDGGRDLLEGMPEHLRTSVMDSYRCCSCHRFISPGPSLSESALHLPPLYERINHLDPGVPLPPPPPPPSPPQAMMGIQNDDDENPAAPRGPESSSMSRSVSRPSHPGTSRRSSAPAPSIGDPTGVAGIQRITLPETVPRRFLRHADMARGIALAPHVLSVEDRVLAALTGRGLTVTPFVIGNPGMEEFGEGRETDWRFCSECLVKHLGVRDEDGLKGINVRVGRGSTTVETVGLDFRGECGCLVCQEERRVLGGGGVLRFFRRREKFTFPESPTPVATYGTA